MELLDAIVILGVTVLVTVAFRAVTQTWIQEIAASKREKSREMRAVRSGKTAPAVTPQNVQYQQQPASALAIPPWVYELGKVAGIGEGSLEDAFESDEMPEELVKLLPMAKAFIEGGGLQKLLQGGGGMAGGMPPGDGYT